MIVFSFLTLLKRFDPNKVKYNCWMRATSSRSVVPQSEPVTINPFCQDHPRIPRSGARETAGWRHTLNFRV